MNIVLRGDLLYASLHLIQKGMKEVTVDNYYDGTKMTIELDERFEWQNKCESLL